MTTVLYAVGDIAPDRDDPRQCFELAAPIINEGDIGFCQLECNLTERGARMPQARHTHRGLPVSAPAIRGAGFDVVSFAGNHCMDWGYEGFKDTCDNLRGAGIAVVGVGDNIAEARTPVIREVNGLKVAFLAYSSILPAAYWADDKRAGCAPLRGHTHYEQIETDQPGTPPRIHTWCVKEDLETFVADIRKVREQADIVIVSVHWGIHFIPATLAAYQREAAYAAIDAGADLILGHHAHILKGIEYYRGKAIFYSLGNFAMDLRMTPEHAASKGFKEIQVLSPEWVPNFDSLYNFPPDSRMTIIVRAELTGEGVAQLAVRPALINDNAQAEPLSATDPRFTKVADYLKWCCESQSLEVDMTVAGDYLVLSPGAATAA